MGVAVGLNVIGLLDGLRVGAPVIEKFVGLSVGVCEGTILASWLGIREGSEDELFEGGELGDSDSQVIPLSPK